MIDLTLDNILIPAITGYENPYHFGTKIEYDSENKGGLSTREVNRNVIMPFEKMRVKEEEVITSDEYTSDVEYDAKLVITQNSDIVTLTLANATYVGCKVTLINNSTIVHNLLCTSVSTGNTVLQPKSVNELIWNGTAWTNFSAPAIGKKVAQYPQEKSPALIYPCTDWEEQIIYEGAFLRSYKESISGAFSEYNQALQLQDQGTGVNGLKFQGSSTTLVSKNPDWTVDTNVDYHNHSQTLKVNSRASSRSASMGTTDEYEQLVALRPQYTASVSKNITTTLSGNHKHPVLPEGTISSTDIETRPENFTMRIWKRIA
jgi:hypothetical protein